MKRLAFLGSGPSSLYTIKYVMEKNKEVLVDIIEKLPVPFGLIRYGVAPDHQEVKVVTSQFIEFINENKKRIRFFGNICVDKDVTFKDLHSSYDGVVVCTGAQKDIELTINKDNLNGVYSAREFVNWYNGYPESNKFDFSKIRNVVIIGNGNVALDCARILAKANEVEPSELRKSDISIPALEMIRCGKLESISVVGRRGPVQAAFTIKELRELTRLPEARVCIDPEDMARGLNEASKFEVAASRPKQRILDLIKQCVSSNTGNESSSLPINLKFLLSPVSINGDSGGIKSVTFEMSELQGIESKQNVVGVGKQKTLPCDLLLIAIGYKATPISGLPFNTSLGVFPSIKGRIIGENKVPIHGCYVSGWAKRGSVGIIGSNISDAKETAAGILEDLSQASMSSLKSSMDPVHTLPALVSPKTVTWQQFLSIEKEEVRIGTLLGRPRDKLITVEEMLRVASLEQTTDGRE